ncbi:MAG: phage head closure protein [Clostridiales bacterium]|jgi:SPP1 family predicted phage head-tail adaptor|nr:phage head closure protein [Clostridiales bacterium]
MVKRTMDIGRLRQRIQVYSLNGTEEDEFGQITNGLTLLGEVWGDLYPVRGQEFYEVQKIQSKVTHKCYVRWRESFAKLDSNCYIKHKGVTYDIYSATDVDMQHKLIEIYCYQRVNKESIVEEMVSDE